MVTTLSLKPLPLIMVIAINIQNAKKTKGLLENCVKTQL